MLMNKHGLPIKPRHGWYMVWRTNGDAHTTYYDNQEEQLCLRGKEKPVPAKFPAPNLQTREDFLQLAIQVAATHGMVIDEKVPYKKFRACAVQFVRSAPASA